MMMAMLYITGSSPGLTSNDDFATIKYNNDGVEQWAVRYNGPGNSNDIAVGIAIDNQRNVIVSGASKGDGTNFDYATIQYNSEGIEQWVSRYNGEGNGWDWPEAVAVDDSGDIIVTGYAKDNAGDDDFITIKYSSQGYEEWISKYNGPGYNYSNHDRACALSSWK